MAGTGMQPLRGLVVLDLSKVWIGPTVSHLLSDFGARVIEIRSRAVDIAEVVDSVQLREREFFTPVAHSVAGTWRYSGAPFKTSFAGWQIRRPAPLLGQHTGEVLQGLGLDVDAIVELERSGVA